MSFVKHFPEIQASIGNYLLPVTLAVCGLLALRYLSRRKLNWPPGPIGLPLVGYQPFLGEEPFKTLDRLRRKYGNVFSLYLGRTYTVILGDYTAVKEAFSKAATNNRPPDAFNFIPDGGGIASANGEDWVEHKRFVLKTMKDVGLGRSSWARLVEEDASEFIRVIGSQKGHPIDFEKFLTNSITDTLVSLIFGKRLPEEPDKRIIIRATNTVLQVLSPSSLWNFFPWLYNLLVALKITRYYKGHCEMVAFDRIIRKEVEQHKESQEYSEKFDFISNSIAGMQNKERKENIYNERNLIANSRGILVAGAETSKTTLTWLFLTIALYPEVQRKVQYELDSILGKEKQATWTDHLKLPYTYAVILELSRWKTVVPLNLTRMTSEDIDVCGYHIPKGTTILSNIWGLHNDSRYWKDPEKFIPERFLQNGVSEVDLKKESFMPFSYGKRKCIGENVAMVQLFLYFTAIMHFFELRVPGGGKPKMEGNLGLIYAPVSQKLCFIPRK